MIRMTCVEGRVDCEYFTEGYGVYLDNDSLGALAKECPVRRSRFVNALQGGGTLLFSLTNAAELAGPQGGSAERIREFLDSIGPHWVPFEMNPWVVEKREANGLGGKAPLSEEFVKAFYHDRSFELSPGGGKILDTSSENFFRLSSVLDWAQENRAEIMEQWDSLDRHLEIGLGRLRTEYEQDNKSFDQQLPPVPFDERWPGRYVMIHLQRILVKEWKSHKFKAHDGRDFSHAVLAAAYAHLGTLDKQWKRRVENIPKPNSLAKMFYRPEIDQLVSELESLVGDRQRDDRAIPAT